MMEYDEEIKTALKTEASRIKPAIEIKERIMELIEFKNSKGHSLGKINIDSFDPSDPINEVRKHLTPGTGKAVYVVDNNPDRIISNETFYSGQEWTDGLEKLRKQFYPYQFKLLGNTELIKIEVIYGFDYLTDTQVMEIYQEASETGSKIIIRELKQNNTIVGVRFHYRKEVHDIEVSILGTTKSRIHVPNMADLTVENFTLNGHDAAFIKDKNRQQLIWVEESPLKLQYEIKTSTEYPNKELISLAYHFK